jgi:acetyl-CoA carboxylase carboxyl transferase subunit beta
MNWLTNVVRPKIRNILRRETPENLWIKCPDSGQLVFYKDVEANQFVIPGSNYHMRMGAVARLKSIFDNETWYDIALPEVTADPLKFRDERKYVDRIKDARAKTGLNDAIKVGYGKLEGAGVVVACRISISWAVRSAWPRARRSCAGSSLRWRRSRRSSCSRPRAARGCRKAFCR